MARLGEERDRREHAAAERLSRFRGDMCDQDFAALVREVVRVHDKVEGRAPMYPWDGLTVNPSMEPELIRKWLGAD
jgi:hypothetical protein